MNPVQHSARFTLPYRLVHVFPLFTPEGEKLWASDWDYAPAVEDTELSEDYVFLTGAHDHASSHAIWLVKSYRPEEGLVEYYRVEPEEKVGVVTVRCRPEGDGGTHVEVTYKYIPLSERGRAFTNSYSQQAHEEFIAGWQTQLESYFERRG
jgi:hypothetical protein